MAYQELSDEDKLAQAITFVAVGHPLPVVLADFLREQGLYDAIVQPGVIHDDTVSTDTAH